MSFLEEIKKEIAEDIPKQNCCQRSMLLGMLLSHGKSDGKDTVSLRVCNPDAARVGETLVRTEYGKQASEIPQQHGGRVRVFTFRSPSAARLIAGFDGVYRLSPTAGGCASCAQAFLRGVFLVTGHMTDPKKGYHLELSVGTRAEYIGTLLEKNYGLLPKTTTRRAETLLYWKDSGAIEDFFMHMGMQGAAFSFMNLKIEKQFRNEANRRANCESGNISRAVGASVKLLRALQYMEEHGLLSSLPEELESTARLRLENPEASITQLASLAVPAVTKSGMNHRLQKLAAYAEANGLCD